MRLEFLDKILKFAVDNGVSDVHLQTDSVPMMRRDGELYPLKHPPLGAAELEQVAGALSRLADEEELRRLRELDGTYAAPGVGRFRFNVYRQRGRFAAVLRVIPQDVLEFSKLHLPPVLERIAGMRRGLVLMTGATGNGKSTAMAALLQHVNRTRRAHVVTIEDPIEFLFDNDQSIISQRELETDTESFQAALRAALRQDPDVIMVGELRDHETTDICLKAAETGHLVMGAIHTPDVAKTIGRLLAYFPPAEQETVRKRIADNLVAVVSLRLLPRKDGQGRVPACEVMLTTRTIGDCILHPDKTGDIPQHMARSQDFGMQTFNQHLVELVQGGAITLEQAKLASTQPEELERALLVS